MNDAKLSPGKFADNNVVSLDARRLQQGDDTKVVDEEINFDAIMKANLEKQNRLTAERAKNNESVTSSYRLKSKPKR